MKRVLLIGGAGYIGSHIALALLNKGCDVAMIDNFDNSDVRNIGAVEQLTGKHITFVNMNVAIPRIEWRDVFRGLRFDAIIHLASYKDVAESNVRPFMYYVNNLDATMNVIRIAARTRTRNIIFSSSAAVYGEQNKIVTEQTKINPMSPYARTKAMSEDILRDTAEQNDTFKVVSLRYFNPLGMQDGLKLIRSGTKNVLDVLNETAHGARRGFEIFGNDYPTKDGTPIRDFIHVSDLAEAHVRTIEYMLGIDFVGMDVYNVGRGEETSVMELVRAYNLTNGTDIEPIFGERRRNDIYYSQASVKKIQKDLGWRATRSLEEMLKQN